MAPWPQPPPPPPASLPPATASWGDGARSGPPGAWGAAWAAPVAPRLAPGRGRVIATAWVAALAAWSLTLFAGYVAVRASALPPDVAGYPVQAGSSTVLLGLGAILTAAALALRMTMRTWLRAVRDTTRAGSVRALLDDVADPASGGAGTLPSARRTAAIILGGLAGAIGAVVAGLALWLLADAPLLARAGLLLVMTGAAACVLVVGLVPSLLRAVERREHLAAPPDPTGRRVPPGLRAPLMGVVAGFGALSIAVLAIASVDAARLAIDGCWPAAGWNCGHVTVAAVPGSTGPRRETVEVAYAVHPADDPAPGGPRRVLLIAVGGPGSSGIAEADWYAQTLPREVLDTHDIVLFDPRGTGSTDRRGCPFAYREYVREETSDRARAFAASCIDEAGAAGMDMRRFGTAAVSGDVEAIRIALGVETMAVYGSSYGTVVAQAYAASHPGRVSGLVLDAPVDRRLDGIEVWRTAAMGFGDVLRQTFEACAFDDRCVAGLADPHAAWDRLVRRLDADGGLSVVLPDGSGTPVGTEASGTEVLGAVRSALYEPTGRATILRALAAADRADDRLLVRLVQSGGDQAWWPEAFAYYATWCADVRASPTGRADDADAYERRLAEGPVDSPGGDSVLRTLMPCLYWPSQPALGNEPPDPADVPTLIISATADPVTPGSEALAIHRRIDGSRLIEVDGGEHVSLGSGDACVDDAVADFLVSGRPPSTSVTRCESWVADRYVPLTPYGSRPVDVPWSIAVELLNDPLYTYWDGESTLVVPCLAGGVARISSDAVDADRVELDGCSMHEGDPPADGSGTISWYGSTAALEVTTPEGRLDFRLADDRASASGTWEGRGYSFGD